MKKLIILITLLLSVYSNSQVLGADMFNLGTKTTVEMNAITVGQGLQVGSYVDNSDTGSLWRYNGSIWVDQAVSGGGGSKHIIKEAATTLADRAALNFSSTQFMLSDDVGNDEIDIGLGFAVFDAANHNFTPTGNTTSTDVQTAIEELQTEIDGLTGGSSNRNHSIINKTGNFTFTSTDQYNSASSLVTVQTAVTVEGTVTNRSASVNENYFVNVTNVGGQIDLIPDSGVTFSGDGIGSNTNARIDGIGSADIFELTDGNFWIDGNNLTWYTPISNYYQETDAANPDNEGNSIGGNWSNSGAEIFQSTSVDSSNGTYSIEANETASGTFSRVDYVNSSMTAGSVTIDFDVRLVSGTTGRLEVRDGFDGTVLDTVNFTANSGVFESLSSTVTLTGTELNLRFYPQYGSAENGTLYIDNINITQ